MSLLYSDLIPLFSKRLGIEEPTIKFNTISAFGNISQPKGIFIPLYDNTKELGKAIENGAIAAIWKEDIPVPDFAPNHFIIFYTNDLWKGLKSMLETYQRKLEQSKSNEQNEKANIYFIDKSSLNEKENTYDIQDLENKLMQLISERNEEGRG